MWKTAPHCEEAVAAHDRVLGHVPNQQDIEIIIYISRFFFSLHSFGFCLFSPVLSLILLNPLTPWAGATVISRYLTIKSQELIKWSWSAVRGSFLLSSSPIISKASCNLLRAFQVCETPLPTDGKSLLPAVIKTDNLTGEKGGGGFGGREKKVKERHARGAFRRLELKQRAFH